MTSGQRKLVSTWAGGLLLLVGVAAAWRYLPPKLHFLVALCVAPFAAIARARTTLGEAEERGRASLNEIANEYPWVKWWVVAWGITFFCGPWSSPAHRTESRSRTYLGSSSWRLR